MKYSKKCYQISLFSISPSIIVNNSYIFLSLLKVCHQHLIALEKSQKITSEVVEKLFDKYYTPLVYFARTFMADTARSEDIVQEAFIQLWEKSDKIVIKSSLKSYLYMMVKNGCLLALKKVNIEDIRDISSLQAALFLADKDDYVAHAEHHNRLIHQIHSAMERFSDQKKKIFIMRYFEQMKYEEIAEALAISVGSVKKQLYRAKEDIIKLTMYFFKPFLSL